MTTLERAIRHVPGFEAMYQKINRRMTLEDKAVSTRTNYCRHIAALALHYDCVPTDLNIEQVEDFLYAKLNEKTGVSGQHFKFTIYGLRYACRVMGKDELRIKLPVIRRQRKLPVVLSKDEIKMMLNKPSRLKYRVMIALLYGCGLRLNEVRNLKLEDIDLDRSVLHVRKSKGRKDRYMPLGHTLTDILGSYIKINKPFNWLFPGYRSNMSNRFYTEFEQPYGKRSIQWAIKRAAQLAGIKKPVNVHSLRHTFATHLLEDGVNILTIKELLGHASIRTTMIYLHVAQVDNRQRRSPLDSLNGVEVIRNTQGEFSF